MNPVSTLAVWMNKHGLAVKFKWLTPGENSPHFLSEHLYNQQKDINLLMQLLARKQISKSRKKMSNYCSNTGRCFTYHIHPAPSTFHNILHLARRWQTRPSIRWRGCRQGGEGGSWKQEQLHHTVFFSAKPGCPAFNTLPQGHAR